MTDPLVIQWTFTRGRIKLYCLSCGWQSRLIPGNQPKRANRLADEHTKKCESGS